MAFSLAAAPAVDVNNTMEYAVQVSARTEMTPAQITLDWVQDSAVAPESYTLFRRSPNSDSWGDGITLPGSQTSFVDEGVSAGSAYEYQIVKKTRGYTGYGYIQAGIRVPVEEYRGKLLLVVDNTHAATLSTELERLRQDITGDGWTVIRIDVDRSATVEAVKGQIKAQYDLDPSNVKAVFLFGHVPVPYSGNIVPDGHYREHEGAWPCDGYYADMDGVWTDQTVDVRIANDSRNHNTPGDGKFDQSIFPSELELMIGRVDLANMPGRLSAQGTPTFRDECELLRNYLNKNHGFRTAQFGAPERAFVGDYFGARDGEAFAASGWRNFAPFFGPSNIQALRQPGTWISTLSSNACLWAYGCGSGSYTSIGGIGRVGGYADGLTTEMVNSNVKTVFAMLYGSWLGDWDSEDNILRAVLATPEYGLASVWSGRPHWFMHHMALGQPIGFSALLTQNNGNSGLYRNQRNSCAGWTHTALMGDPTLRMHVVAPPTEVAAHLSNNAVILSWTAAAADDAIEGYNVYRAANESEPFVRVNKEVIKGNSFIDADAALGAHAYMVRAVKLQASASGTYVNLSQGAIVPAFSAPQEIAVATNVPAVVEETPAVSEISGELLSATGETSDALWYNDSLPAGAIRDSSGGDNWAWVTSNPAPFSGSAAHQSAIASGLHQHFFSAATPMNVAGGDRLIAYVYVDPSNVPQQLMLQWSDGNWEHRAYWGDNHLWWGTDGTASSRRMGAMPPAGQWVRLEVPAVQVGLEGRPVSGMAFTLFGGRATFDYVGRATTTQTATPPPATNNVPSTIGDVSWVNDALPSGAVGDSSGGDTWDWVASNPSPQLGAKAHQSTASAGLHQHFFTSASPLAVGSGDKLYTYVYLDPANPPSQVMLQWYDGSWEHRAYWGDNHLWWGTDGTANSWRAGPLPAAGQWARLEVPAAKVGLENRSLTGMAFTLFGGKAAWDNAGKSGSAPVTPPVTNSTPANPGNGTSTNSTPSVPPATSNSVPVINTNQPVTTTTNFPAVSLASTNPLLPGTSVIDNLLLQMPKVGDYGLHVLTPTLLELKLFTTKDPNAASVSTWNLVNGALTFIAPGLNEFVVTANGQPVGVTAVGFKRRPLYAPLVNYDLRIENSLYLQLSAPLSDNQTVVVRNPTASLWTTNMTYAAAVDPLRYSPAIHVNHEGYMPGYSKKSMVGYYIGNLGELNVIPSAGFKLVNAKTGATVFNGNLTQRSDVGYSYTPKPYQLVYEADFTSFNVPGEYRLVVPGMGASLPFNITEGVAMNFARAYALGLYHQRCGADNVLPFTRHTHEKCHVAPADVPASSAQFPFTWSKIAEYANIINPDNPQSSARKLTGPDAQLYPFVRTGKIDVSGGHHDAGDYSKYTLNSVALIHYLTFAADSLPGVKSLDNLGIPESGDGISDMLQEAKWEADFLAKMQDSDGGFYFLVYPHNREYEGNVLPENGDPQLVWPKTATATASSVAALAEIGSSPAFKAHYPHAAALYMQKAQLGWQFLMNAIAQHGRNGIYQKITHYGDDFGDNDELAWAAASLFAATGDPQYQQKLMEFLPDPTHPSTFRWGWWRLFLCYGNAVRNYAFAVRSGRLQPNQVNAAYMAKCESVIVAAGDDYVTWSKQNAYGTSFPEATKRVRGAGWYFSGEQTFDLTVAYQITAKPDYITAILANMNFEGGCNPVNVSYVTGMGWKRERDAVSQYAANDRRLIPPTGQPIGNIQWGFSYLDLYRGTLAGLTFPHDEATVAPHPFYDRWADSWNVSTEYVTFLQARSLATYGFLAAQTSLKTQPWKSAQAHIVIPQGTITGPVTFSLQAPGLDLSDARIVWETRDGDPYIGPTYSFTPRNNGTQWIEAEAQLPDGRRVFATAEFTARTPNVVWIDDALPAGADPASDGGDSWSWISGSPTPVSGTLAHESGVVGAIHQHFFRNATATMKVETGSVLYAYIYLDPANPPTSAMLQWYDGNSWEYRAYWGANNIPYGVDGTVSRRRIGDLPAAGQWVQLRIPANQVGLEGKTLSGMAFTLNGGRAYWDAAGLINPSATNAPGNTNSTLPVVTVSGADGALLGNKPGRFTFTRSGNTSSPLNITYSLSGPAASGVTQAAAATTQTLSAAGQPATSSIIAAPTVTIPAGATSATLTVNPTPATNLVEPKSVTATVAATGTYQVGTPANATVVIAGNAVDQAALSVTAGSPRLSWASTAGAAYRIAYKNSLGDPAWTYLPNSITATGSQTSWTDTSKTGQRFYLILQVQ
ncbi:MAG TPA: glycoside hydrolase family 9 protein [Verrucomicrobiae bacterium]|nr:glycoside hydrolase family 9 protein [Verrucomicrobiae bacterium]